MIRLSATNLVTQSGIPPSGFVFLSTSAFRRGGIEVGTVSVTANNRLQFFNNHLSPAHLPSQAIKPHAIVRWIFFTWIRHQGCVTWSTDRVTDLINKKTRKETKKLELWKINTVLLCKQGRSEGGEGGTMPRSPNFREGTEKPQECHKYFLQYCTFTPEVP